MKNDLERGIIAARKGHKAEAKALLIRVLKQNNRNEQAWLWLSDVVDTIGEQITCIEQVLQIDPDHAMAKMALKKLRSQPSQRSTAFQLTPESPSIVDKFSNEVGNEERKPFRLSEPPPQATQSEGVVHHQATMSFRPMPAPDRREHNQALLRQADMSRRRLSKANGVSNPPPAVPTNEPEGFPLMPLILFGALSVTAIGGLVMMLLLLFLG